jgi:hypothetical protein
MLDFSIQTSNVREGITMTEINPENWIKLVDFVKAVEQLTESGFVLPFDSSLELLEEVLDFVIRNIRSNPLFRNPVNPEIFRLDGEIPRKYLTAFKAHQVAGYQPSTGSVKIRTKSPPLLSKLPEKELIELFTALRFIVTRVKKAQGPEDLFIGDFPLVLRPLVKMGWVEKPFKDPGVPKGAVGSQDSTTFVEARVLPVNPEVSHQTGGDISSEKAKSRTAYAARRKATRRRKT